MRKLLLNVTMVMIGLSGFAQTEIDFKEYTLDNGLHVILHEDHSTPIVAVSVLYHVGSKNEKPGRSGFAHFFEHLMFEGSANIDRGEFMKIVQSNGGTLNANTSHDRTFYYEILPSNQLELGLWLESERMLHATVDETGVETQREVVKEEKLMRYDNRPYGSFIENMFSRAYVVHPYQNIPIGSMADLDAAGMEDFTDFYKTYYVPNNATLSIAGDLEEKEAMEMIEIYFGSIPSSGKPIKKPDSSMQPLTSEVMDTIYDNIQLPAVFLGYRMPPQGTKDAYAIEMLTTLLSDGQSSRLYKRFVDGEKLAVAVQAFPYGLEDGGLFITLGVSNMGKDPKELKKGIDEEIKEVRTNLISEKEYTRVLNQLENNFIASNSSMAGIAESLANYHVYFNDANLINTEIEKYRAITREDLKQAAKQYLKDNSRVVLYYLPKEQ